MDMGMAAQHRGEQVALAVDRTSPVARRVQHQPLGVRRDRRVQRFGALLEAVEFIARDENRPPAGECRDRRPSTAPESPPRRPDRGWRRAR